MQHKATRSWSLPAVILALVLAAALVAQVLAQAAVSNQAFAAQTNLIADGNTTTSYKASLGDETSTCYAGRVWTDKTVYTEDATFENENTIGKGDSNFLVAYSAMATSQSISGKTQVPIDVVFIVDLSGSMSNKNSGMNDGKSRIAHLVDALNTSVETLMDMNPYTRIGVVGYSSTAVEILPLDHYTKMTGKEQKFFTLNHTTPSGTYATLTTHAVDSSNRIHNQSFNVQGGTNVQMGVYKGMNMLATEDSKTVEENGQILHRVPSVILLSDGAATYSSDSTQWWAPANNSNNGPGTSSYYGNGMKAMMTASYMKQAIDRNYQPISDEYATTVYTIGIGTSEMSEEDKNLANITLNPKEHWNDDNPMANDIRQHWEETWATGVFVPKTHHGYAVQKEDGSYGTPDIEVAGSGTFTLTHPNQYDIVDVGLQYNDAYYTADTAQDVTNVFKNIVGSISISRPFVPTETAPEQPDTSGYITYTDPIGPYMEVKDVKALLWSGQLFDQKKVGNSGNTTTYTFEGKIDSPVYDGKHNVSEIQITVTTDPASQDQTLTVKIPASCIPLRVNTIMLDSDGKVESNQSNGAYPFRLLYTVDLKDGVITNDGRVNPDVVSNEYIAANTEGGKVNFYSNQYSGTVDEDGKTRGDATVTFTPASDNPFYFVQEDTPLYLDKDLTQPATEYYPNTPYYFPVSYYEGNTKQTTVVSRSSGLMDDYIKGIGGQLNLKAGSPRLGSLTEFIKDKDTPHTTNTASTSYYPTLDDSNSQTGNYVVYLGNNGKLQVDAPLIPPGDLTISKTVAGNQGETEKDFVFDVTLTNTAETLAGPYAYTKTNADAAQTTGTVSVDGQGRATFTPMGGGPGQLTLKHGETVIISGLPAGTSFTVTEQDPNTNGESYETSIAVNGETQTSGNRTASGAIVSKETQRVAYTNTWEVKMHTFTFTKIDGTNQKNPLAGAQFKLFKPVCKDSSHNHESELIEEPFNPDPNCWELVRDEDHPDGVFISDEDGEISFYHLLANGVTYRLIEVAAPIGFQRPRGQWNLSITQFDTGAGGINDVIKVDPVGAMGDQPAFIRDGTNYYIPNYRPMDPPITGGRGLTGFMLGGGLLIAAGLSAAAFWLIRSSKKKRNYRYR